MHIQRGKRREMTEWGDEQSAGLFVLLQVFLLILFVIVIKTFCRLIGKSYHILLFIYDIILLK